MPEEPERSVGVGPWPGGKDAWPHDPKYDPELLEHGDTRNVIDAYRYWSVEAIVDDLDTRRHGFHVAIENWQHDFNIGSIVRTANAFMAQEIHIVGRRRWNKRGAMVTDRYQHIRYHETVEEFREYVSGLGIPLIGIENVDGALPIETASIPKECVLFFGSESSGLSEDALQACNEVYAIAQYGSTRSINAGAAAAIAMHTWVRQHLWETP